MDYKPAGCPPLLNLCSFSQKDAKTILKNGSFLARVPGIKIIETPFGTETVAPTPHGRILIVIPRKVGPACTRNLIRRRIRALYLEEKLYTRQSATMIFMYPEARNFTYDQLRTFMIGAFNGRPHKKMLQTTTQECKKIT